ncbi:hypothetical protein RRG08_034281 [Elysia crispata]|uniref:Methyltransferase domain-containing protein n=1 Tax=Elysia crispata TaxID=231223 RepID=A0AAE1DRI4_9GAST|nr:hypothetical protein RRG08_034281 [Elysia crispata]
MIHCKSMKAVFRILKGVSYQQGQMFVLSHFHDEKLSKFTYWKNRYKEGNQEVFEWFVDPDEIVEPILNNIAHIQAQSTMPLRYIDIGCGLSDLSLHLTIHCPRPLSAVIVDFVSEALQYQNKSYVEYQQMIQLRSESTQHLVCADVLHLPFRDGGFDVAIDKGTMDALMKDKVQGHFKSGLMMGEVIRLLIPGGRYLQISDEDPDSRLLFLENISTRKHDCDERVKDNHREATKATTNFHEQMKLNHKLSSWKFKSIQSKSGSEYFLYWAERL